MSEIQNEKIDFNSIIHDNFETWFKEKESEFKQKEFNKKQIAKSAYFAGIEYLIKKY